MIRGYALTALENQNLWHERDISHSSTERVIIPDATILLDYMFEKMIDVMDGLVVNADNMMRNLEGSSLIFYSQPLLLRLVNKGITREDAYRMVQRRAHDAFDTRSSFEVKVREDDELSKVLSKEEFDEVFSLDRYKENIALIYDRLGIQ